jgi:hypothetical protein
MKLTRWTIALAAAVLVAGTLDADVLTLKDGTVMNGTFLSSDGKTIIFKSNIGQLSVEKAKVASIAFTSPGSAVTSPPTTSAPSTLAPATAAAAAAEPKQVTLKSGTELLVKMTSSVSSKNQAGTPFTSVLLYDLEVDGAKVAKAGTRIIGRVQSASEPRGLRGQTTLDIRLTEMVLGSRKVRLTTGKYQAAGEKGAKQAARGAAAGAAIGAIADGGDGAAKGAAIGAGVGVLKKGRSITIPPGTVLEFSLTQPVKVTVDPD